MPQSAIFHRIQFLSLRAISRAVLVHIKSIVQHSEISGTRILRLAAILRISNTSSFYHFCMLKAKSFTNRDEQNVQVHEGALFPKPAFIRSPVMTCTLVSTIGGSGCVGYNLPRGDDTNLCRVGIRKKNGRTTTQHAIGTTDCRLSSWKNDGSHYQWTTRSHETCSGCGDREVFQDLAHSGQRVQVRICQTAISSLFR